MTPCAVYYLRDPRTQEVRYVGISVDPMRRLKGHLKARGSRHSACWIRQLQALGLVAQLRVVVWAEGKEEAARIEIALIARLPNLTNHTLGGDGGSLGFRWSRERKEVHSAQLRKRYEDPAERLKTGKANAAALADPRVRARYVKASTGRFHTDEAKAKISQTLMGHSVSVESREKTRLSHLGRKHSEETKAKMSSSRMGHVVTEEAKQKARASHLRRRAEQQLISVGE